MLLAPLAAAVIAPTGPLDLAAACQEAASQALVEFKTTSVAPEHLSLFVMVRPKGEREWKTGGHRESFAMYPASVVKLYYLAYGGWKRDHKGYKPSEEDLRAFTDMIVDSSNDGTGHVLDVLTGTSGGPELGPASLKSWMGKRQAVNRWLKTLGIPDTNACQKTWNEGPYGRERQGYGPNYELRNMATAKSSALMMAAIVDGVCGKGETQKWMLGLLHRSLDKQDAQTRMGIGKVVPKDWTHHSKAGWAYEVRHDVAYLVSPKGDEVILAVYTDKNKSNFLLLPFLAESVLKSLGVVPPEDRAWAEPVDLSDE